MRRRDFIKTAGVGAASMTMPFQISSCTTGVKKPNIIFILADDLGYGDLGCYGQKRIKTPHIDAMAKEGMRFTQHYAGSTVCAPSRCSLMTGLHTGHAYVRGNYEIKPMGQVPLMPDTVTLSSQLKAAGYTTALIGKWGLGGPDSTGTPNRQGFDYFFGYLCQRHAHNYYPEYLFRNDKTVPLEGNVLPEPKRLDGAGQAVEKAQYSHDLFAAEALQFVEENQDNPFFLYLAMTIPHANNEAGKEGMEVPELGDYADKDWPEPEKGKAAMISRMDRDVGNLLQKLRDLGIAENTLVVFTSDNGPHREGGAQPDFSQSSGGLRGIKRDLYEGGIRVPMIAWWPGSVKAGSTSDHVSAFWDYMPTFSEIAQKPVRHTDGISLLPTLTGEAQNQMQHDFLYWEFHERGSKQAVRMGDWKGVRLSPDAELELYNLKDDIAENTDMSAQHPEIVNQITSYMKETRLESQFWPLKTKEG
jgi:arylsulfatase A-like enzyme